jgi:protein TonB
LTYTVAFTVAAFIHIGLAIGAGGYFRSPADRATEMENSVEERSLTLTFHRPNPVHLQPKPTVPLRRDREPIPMPTSASEPAADVPDPTSVSRIGESPARETEPRTAEAADTQLSSVTQPSTEHRNTLPKFLPPVPMEKPRPLQPIDAEAVYPLGARLRGEEGTVRLTVRIGIDGRLEDLEINESSGFTAIDRAAERAVRRTRFAPATRNNPPVPSELTITIHFSLGS